MTKVAFCGISGSGMSALAQVLKSKGFEVSGSDRSFDQGKDDANKKALQQIGINIFAQDGSGIDENTDCLYVSTAVEESIPDVKKALNLNIPVKKRSDLLAEIFNDYPYGVAVGGTSGKTTVTAMIGWILDNCGKNPMVINGGLLKNYVGCQGIPNVVLNKGNICVVEADESDGSIEKYFPYIAVVNNISVDHKPIEELKTLFYNFTCKAKGGAVVNLDCKNSYELLDSNKKVVTFSIKNSNADIFAEQIKPILNGVEYVLDGRVFYLKISGTFNVENALAAIAAAELMGIERFKAAEILQSFLGTKRRLEVVGTCCGVTVIDDFAHNPDKVRASVSALRDYAGRLLIMFQPHGFAPMRLMGREIIDSFADTMQQTDKLFIPEIYYVGGTVKRDISSADLIDYAKTKGVDAYFCENREQAASLMLTTAEQGDRIVVMGARDNTLPDFCLNLLERIK